MKQMKLAIGIIAAFLFGRKPANVVTQTHRRRAYRPQWPPTFASIDDAINYNLAAGRLAVGLPG